MKKILLTLLLLMPAAMAHADFAVFFSPYDNLEDQWVRMIKAADTSIKISCFGLTNGRIYQALVDQHKRGVKVLICEDKMQSAGAHDTKNQLRRAGIEVVVKPVQVLEHNKMLVVDDDSGIVGSWNLSESAQAQDNSIIVYTHEPEIADRVSKAIDRIYDRDSGGDK